MESTYRFYEKDNLGIERHNMPQIDEENLDDFLIHYADKAKVTKLKMSLDLIKPTQNAINEDKILQMIASSCDWKNRKYIVSSDNYLLDGHHCYALGLEFEPDYEVTVYRVNLKMKELLKRTKQMKIATKVDINDDIVKGEDLVDLMESGCKFVTDIHLEEQLQNIYEEYGFEKAIPSHLVKKIIINKLGHKQTVWVDPNTSNGTKFDFNKYPYKGVNGAFLGQVEMAVGEVLKKKDIDFKNVNIRNDDNKKVVIIADGKKETVEWYKTKNFATNGIIGIKHDGKIHEKKIKDHEIEVEYENNYLQKIEDKRKQADDVVTKITDSVESAKEGLIELGGFKAGQFVSFKDGDKELKGEIKTIKHHEKYDKFGTALIEDSESGKLFSRSLKKVENVLDTNDFKREILAEKKDLKSIPNSEKKSDKNNSIELEKITSSSITKYLKNNSHLLQEKDKEYLKLVDEYKPSQEIMSLGKGTSFNVKRSFFVYDSSAKSLNRVLRGQKLTGNDAKEKVGARFNPDDDIDYITHELYYLEHAKVIQKVIDNSPLKENLILYRGFNGSMFNDIKIGETFEEQGFTSTSINPLHTLRFAFGNTATGQVKDDHVMFKINAKKGTKAIPISSISDHRLSLAENNVNEVILQSGTRFKVTGITEKEYIKGVKTKIIEVETFESDEEMKEEQKSETKTIPKAVIYDRPEMENPVYSVKVGGEDKFIQRQDGMNPGDTAWYEVIPKRREVDGESMTIWNTKKKGGYDYSHFQHNIGYNKKEAVDELVSRYEKDIE